MIYSDWLTIGTDITLKAGRTVKVNDSVLTALLPAIDAEREYFDVKIQVVSGVPTGGSLIGVHLKYADEPMPMANYNPRFRGRVMTDERLGIYHSMDLFRLERDMQLCLKSNELETDLVINVYIRSKG